MIGKLSGIIDSFGEDHVIIDVNGVGYVVTCSSRTLQRLPKRGEPASLAIETQVREDAIRLFGFTSDGERDWFRLLQSVQGVGAKVALAILGILSAGELATAIGTQDKGERCARAGRWPKLAARIVAELKDKAPALAAVDPVVARLAGEEEAKSAPRPCRTRFRRWSISATAAAGGGGRCRERQRARRERRGAALIRRGLKELAQ
jgi:Holliday junction DNA helicase RuvA